MKVEKFIGIAVVSYLLVIALMAVSLFMSCNKKGDGGSYSGRCMCILRNAEGALLGSNLLGDEIPRWVAVYPNPAPSELRIDFMKYGDYMITISDMGGKKLFQQLFECKEHITALVINISIYPDGKYQLTIESDKQRGKFCLFKREPIHPWDEPSDLCKRLPSM